MQLRGYKTVNLRRQALEKKLNLELSHSGNFSLDEITASAKNCENMIGATQVPLGVAGPLIIGKKEYYIPIATTEGALIASINRGCKVITQNGGAVVFAQKEGTTRGPVFTTGSLEKSNMLVSWIEKNEQLLKQTAQETSSHLKYKKVMIRQLADYVFVRFVFDTSLAMGMNMVTIATEKMAQFITDKTGVSCLAVAGNFDVDKKPAWMNMIERRGLAAWAEVIIKEDDVKQLLKTTSQQFFDIWLAKCMIGSAMSGSLGFNAQFANVIAGIFIATGQDPAHIVEGSMGITTVNVLPQGDLHVSVYLPCLMIGLVGGGTNLATQKEALHILGLSPKNKIETFAEIIAAAVLAGEISLLASLSEGSLAKAHQKLGRGKR